MPGSSMACVSTAHRVASSGRQLYVSTGHCIGSAKRVGRTVLRSLELRDPPSHTPPHFIAQSGIAAYCTSLPDIA
eukprot:619973-Rhodomonas_salina.5